MFVDYCHIFHLLLHDIVFISFNLTFLQYLRSKKFLKSYLMFTCEINIHLMSFD